MLSIDKITNNLEKKYWIYTLFCPFIMILEVFFETIIPFFMSRIVDKGILNKDMNYVLKIGTIMIVCAVLSMICGIMGARFGAIASQGVSKNLRRNLFKKVQSFSFYNVDKFSTASLVTRLTTDVTNVQNVYQLIIRICFRAPFMLIAGSVMAFFINTKLALIFFISIPILGVSIALISTKAYSKFAYMLEKYDKLNSIVQENLIAIRVVKSFVRGDFESEKFASAANNVRKAQSNAEKLVIRISPIMQLVLYLTIIAVFWFGGKMVVFGSMKSGELISFLSYVYQILMSLMMIGMIFVNIVLSRASVRRICEVLDEVPAISNKNNAITFVKDGSICFKDVFFSYNKNQKNYILENISLNIDSGQVVGIIGGTGSSKTSLVNLIPRLYDVLKGAVLVGGINVKEYDLKVLRDSVAVVLQKNVLFSGTIKENLKWGNQEATDEQIVSACKISDADDFINSFPNKYETYLGQGGVNISGGQKQRLCIARALLKKPKILILDDSTSSVDTATERKIRDSLRKECPETTKIIIAQRITSVKDADVIFVIENGKICGFGKHEDLIKSNSIYKEVNDSQITMGDADI